MNDARWAGGRVVVGVRRLHPERDADLPLPCYMTPGASGMDVVASIDGDLVLDPGAREAVPTGLAFSVPEGYEIQVRPRSGLALRHGLAVINAPGTLDSDYRGELRVLLANFGDQPITLSRGERIAQLVVAPVAYAELEMRGTLDDTPRGTGGFGHTGR